MSDKAESGPGPNIVPILGDNDYLRRSPAPDFWALMPFYIPQSTEASCTVASIAMAVNALRGLPDGDEALVTEAGLLEAVGGEWSEDTAEESEGIGWTEFEAYLRQSLAAYGLEADVEIWYANDQSAATLDEMRRLLADNERSSDDIVLAAFNQGVVTGIGEEEHVSPIGAYDAERRRVLIMDTDREWYVPYWTSDERLLASMQPFPHDPEPGGLVRIRLCRKTAAA